MFDELLFRCYPLYKPPTHGIATFLEAKFSSLKVIAPNYTFKGGQFYPSLVLGFSQSKDYDAACEIVFTVDGHEVKLKACDTENNKSVRPTFNKPRRLFLKTVPITMAMNLEKLSEFLNPYVDLEDNGFELQKDNGQFRGSITCKVRSFKKI